MRKALLIAIPLFLSACGGVQVAASGTLREACGAASEEIVERYEAGELEQDQALDYLDGARIVCHGAHDLVVELGDNE
jgi:hypothetical protein